MSMQLRALEAGDAKLMAEWMHDKNVCRYMKKDFGSMTVEDCERFIASCSSSSEDLHMAVADDSGEYMGTVSLKHIGLTEGTAEFAIVVRSCAMGKGYSSFGMAAVIKMGFEKLGLKRVIWCVSRDNLRAERFYVRNGYRQFYDVPEDYRQLYPDYGELDWFEAVRPDDV